MFQEYKGYLEDANAETSNLYMQASNVEENQTLSTLTGIHDHIVTNRAMLATLNQANFVFNFRQFFVKRKG